jgi:hypothetical protein
MRSFHILAPLAAMLFLVPLAALPAAQVQHKDYLSDEEADKIRDAETPSQRIKLYVSFAEDRLKKFEYEVSRTVPERRRRELLNNMLNAYAGCMDDAADQIAVAREKQQDARIAVKLIATKGKEFLDILEKYQKSGPDLPSYKDTLDDAIDGTKDALADAAEAEKEMPPSPVRRKQ